jgi:hypothetical protein
MNLRELHKVVFPDDPFHPIDISNLTLIPPMYTNKWKKLITFQILN